MTVEAGVAVERVATLVTMLIGELRLIVVAIRAGEHAIVARVRVALRTRVPLTIVVPAVDGEILGVMVERGGLPSTLTMALGAIHRELGSRVVRVSGGVVIRHMASTACRRGSRVTVSVAIDARRGRMRAMQRKTGRVVIEGGVAPSGLVMTRGAIRAEARSSVVRVRGGVVVRHVTGVTCCGGARITVRMAFDTCGGHMRSMQWEIRVVVIEGGVAPGRLIMAHDAIRAEARGSMVGLRSVVVFGQMAGTARCWCARVAIRMALDARGGHVCPVQREVGDVMVEGCSPARAGGVAACTIGGEASGLVVRVGGAVVLRHMATGTFR